MSSCFNDLVFLLIYNLSLIFGKAFYFKPVTHDKAYIDVVQNAGYRRMMHSSKICWSLLQSLHMCCGAVCVISFILVG
jgi:hypothetical protein